MVLNSWGRFEVSISMQVVNLHIVDPLLDSDDFFFFSINFFSINVVRFSLIIQYIVENLFS